MGKKNSAFKNIMVTLGCTAFAGVYVLGGGYVVSAFMGGENGARPAWLERVEICVEENAPQSSASGTSVTHNGNNDRSDSGDTLQKPRFEEDEEETQTETEESEYESETETELDDDLSEEPEDDESTEEEEERESVAVSHVQTIEQEDQALAVMADVSAVVKTAMPCVVSITNEYTAYDYWYDEEYDELVNGSGIVVAQGDDELLIVTNYHVVENNNNLYVQFIDDEEAVAYVKGVSMENDLAIVSVFLEDMSDDTLESIAIAALGDSDSLQVGEPAIAIGNSLGYGQSVTTGVISALNRNVFADDPDMISGYLIQTDAAINPGNSGGALLNIKGEVIGINSNKIGGSAVEGMGYAIPISSASPIIAELMLNETKSKVAEEERGYLGISGISVTQEVSQAYGMPEGVYIAQVYPDTAAEAAGLKQGDIITKFGGNTIRSMDELQKELEFYAKGDIVEVKVMTMTVAGYEEVTKQLTLGNKVSE